MGAFNFNAFSENVIGVSVKVAANESSRVEKVVAKKSLNCAWNGFV